MHTAQLEVGYSQTGTGRIHLIFGDYSRNIAHILLDDNRLIHLHGTPGIDQVVHVFGSLHAARGSRIRFTADALGVLMDLSRA